jgi:hypothetical protein
MQRLNPNRSPRSIDSRSKPPCKFDWQPARFSSAKFYSTGKYPTTLLEDLPAEKIAHHRKFRNKCWRMRMSLAENRPPLFRRNQKMSFQASEQTLVAHLTRPGAPPKIVANSLTPQGLVEFLKALSEMI